MSIVNRLRCSDVLRKSLYKVMTDLKPAASVKWDSLFAGGAKYRNLNEVFVLDLLDQFETATGHAPTAVIDLGCGDGETLKKFSMRGFPLIGIDFSKVALNLAMSKFKEDESAAMFLFWDLADISRLSIETPEGSLWLCKFVFAFLDEKVSFLRQVHSRMKEGDKFLLMTSVVHKGVVYTPEDKPGIAVEIEMLKKMFVEEFGDVSVFSNEYPGDRGHIVSYLVQK